MISEPIFFLWSEIMFVILTSFVTFILTTILYGCLLFLACRRVAIHLRGNAVAAHAVAEHVLLPIIGRKEEKKPEEDEDEGDAVDLADVDLSQPEPPRGRTSSKARK